MRGRQVARPVKRLTPVDRMKAALTNGLIVAGRRYEFLAYSSSQLREASVWMFAPTAGLTAAHIRDWMGDFSSIRCPAKFGARMGQCFSSTYGGVTLYVRASVTRCLGSRMGLSACHRFTVAARSVFFFFFFFFFFLLPVTRCLASRMGQSASQHTAATCRAPGTQQALPTRFTPRPTRSHKQHTSKSIRSAHPTRSHNQHGGPLYGQRSPCPSPPKSVESRGTR